MPVLSITILGCGSSGGVPRVGSSGWSACNPDNPKNRRRRCSIMIRQTGEEGTTHVLVDTSPDLREQLLSVDARHLDAVFLTHMHADHIHGIDDLRPLVADMGKKIPVYASPETSAGVESRFDYCFVTPKGSNYPPILDLHTIIEETTTVIKGAGGDIALTPFYVTHGDIQSFGFRFGSVAYIPDVSFIPPKAMKYIEKLDILIIDALREKPHPSHFCVMDALNLIDISQPKKAVLTNLNNDLDYDTLRTRLPSHIFPAYDGMHLEISAL